MQSLARTGVSQKMMHAMSSMHLDYLLYLFLSGLHLLIHNCLYQGSFGNFLHGLATIRVCRRRFCHHCSILICEFFHRRFSGSNRNGRRRSSIVSIVVIAVLSTLGAAENQSRYKPAYHCEQGAPRSVAECASAAARKRSINCPNARKQRHEKEATDGHDLAHDLAMQAAAAYPHPHHTHEPECTERGQALRSRWIVFSCMLC